MSASPSVHAMKKKMERMEALLSAHGLAVSPAQAMSPAQAISPALKKKKSNTPSSETRHSEVSDDPEHLTSNSVFLLLSPPTGASMFSLIQDGGEAMDKHEEEEEESSEGGEEEEVEEVEGREHMDPCSLASPSSFLDASKVHGTICREHPSTLSTGQTSPSTGKSSSTGKSGKSSSSAGKSSKVGAGKRAYQLLPADKSKASADKSTASADKSTAIVVTSSTLTNVSSKSENPSTSKRCPWENMDTDEWLHKYSSEETKRTYRRQISDLFGFLSGHQELDPKIWHKEVTYLQLLAWREHVQVTASKSTKQPRVAAVKSMFKTLRQRRKIKEDPAYDLNNFKKVTVSKTARYCSPQQVAGAFEQCTTPRDTALFAGCYYGMLRKKEGRKLQKKYCTFVMVDGKEMVRLHVIGKGKDEKERDVLVGETGTTLLKPVIMACVSPDAYLFPGKVDGTPLSSRQTYQRVKNVFKKASLPKASTHWLRHAGASHAYDNGATLVQLRDMLGHTDVKVTSNYLHSADDSAAARALDNDYDSETTAYDSDEDKEEQREEIPPMTQTKSVSKKKSVTKKSVRERLEEVDALRRDQLINDDEKQKMRAVILADM